MRKYKQSYNMKYGICILVLSLVVTQAGITKIRNTEADADIKTPEVISYEIKTNNKIPSRSLNSIYIESEKTVNIYPQRPKYKLNLDERYQDLIWNLCLKNDMSYEFVLAVFHYESGFNFKAINKNKDGSTDVSISQLNNYYIDNHRELAIKYCELSPEAEFNISNPDHNIRAGIGNLVYLRDYWKQRGVSDDFSIQYITGSFNMGLVGFQKYIKETGKIEREYSRQILNRKYKLETSNTL